MEENEAVLLSLLIYMSLLKRIYMSLLKINVILKND